MSEEKKNLNITNTTLLLDRENRWLLKDLQMRGVMTLKAIRCFNCGKQIPNFEEIKKARVNVAKQGLENDKEQYMEIYGGFCSMDCVKAKTQGDCKDIVEELHRLYAELFNTTVRIEKITFDENNEVIKNESGFDI